jgi:hypothetical protein
MLTTMLEDCSHTWRFLLCPVTLFALSILACSGQVVTKEYVRLNGRIIATESVGLQSPLKIGTYRPSNAFFVLDMNGDFVWTGPPNDRQGAFGPTDVIPLVGAWTVGGTQRIGTFNPAVGRFTLDINGNGVWNAGVDVDFLFGAAGDVPVIGDWNGDGKTKVGIFRPSTATWLLDYNGNFVWDGPAIDRQATWGSPGDTPVVGDWNGNGQTKIGVMTPQAVWLVDFNGNFTWDGAIIDRQAHWGSPGDKPVVGDWNGSGQTKFGIFNPTQAVWLLDLNGNFAWDGPPVDRQFSWGSPGDIPVLGDWNGNNRTKVGIMTPSATWLLDYNGNFVWDGVGADIQFTWGTSGDIPLVGSW